MSLHDLRESLAASSVLELVDTFDDALSTLNEGNIREELMELHTLLKNLAGDSSLIGEAHDSCSNIEAVILEVITFLQSIHDKLGDVSENLEEHFNADDELEYEEA